MKEPLCLVQNGADGVLSPNPAALEVLRGIGQPVVVVAITGPYRTSKSFLMNRLEQRSTNYALGSIVHALTKGIWMWCLPHPYRPDTTLVLLDTEGLEDPYKGDSRNDAWIFTLALLLSSTLVYNSVGTIDHQALQHLGFVWAVRDFMLELSQDGQRITADEYLEHALRLQPGTAAAPRCCIRVRHGKRYRERVASEAVAAVVVAAVVEAAKAFDAWHEEQRRSFEEHQRQLEERLWREQRAVLELAGLIESALN